MSQEQFHVTAEHPPTDHFTTSPVSAETGARSAEEAQATAHGQAEDRIYAAGKETRMLFRHPTHKLIGGVCGGLADYLGLDPVLVRILWIVATISTAGGGFLAYLALWLLLPVGTSSTGAQTPATLQINERNVQRGGAVLLGLGFLWLLSNLGILPALWSGFWSVVGLIFWPAVLISAGLLLMRSQSAGDWRVSFRQSLQEARSRLSGYRINRERVQRGFRQTKERIPLKRSRTDRLFLGVCGGIGRTLGIDANLVRLIWAAFSIGSLGTGVLIYVLVALLLPEEPVVPAALYDEGRDDIQVIDVTANRSVQV